MAAKKAELLLKKFEENVVLERFYLDQNDQASLVAVLREQEELLPVLIRHLVELPDADPLRNRLLAAGEARALLEKRVGVLLGEISRELGRLRQSGKRLHDWKKAWRAPGEAVRATTYA